MYLTDEDLHSRLDQFEFLSEDSKYPFSPDDQIGPCSVDLRLSNQFWRLRPKWRRGARPIRIGRITLEQIQPRRQWQRVELQDAEVLRLHPHEMVIARTAERFKIPNDCAGLIQGRSSYARLGLSVHPSAGFINPGWSGQFPLPLMNESDATLEIPRLTSVCQLLVVQLKDLPAADYAARASKYQQDDGGPSYWWRDDVLKELVGDLPGNIGDHLVRDLDEALSKFPEDLVHALDEYFDLDRDHLWTDTASLLEDFARVERKKHWRYNTFEIVGGGAAGSLVAAAPFMDFTWTGFTSLLAGLLLGVLTALHRTTRREFFDPRRLEALRR